MSSRWRRRGDKLNESKQYPSIVPLLASKKDKAQRVLTYEGRLVDTFDQGQTSMRRVSTRLRCIECGGEGFLCATLYMLAVFRIWFLVLKTIILSASLKSPTNQPRPHQANFMIRRTNLSAPKDVTSLRNELCGCVQLRPTLNDLCIK
jgi:hypothetical protein